MPACDDDRIGNRVDEPSPVGTDGNDGVMPGDVPATDEWIGCTGQCVRCRYRVPCEAGVPIEPGR